MKEIIFNTKNSWNPFILRIIIGLVILAHGTQKLFGWFDGYGFKGTMQFFTETVGLPWIAGLLIILLETFGAVALIAGFGTRLLATIFTLLALGIIITTHFQNGFFMNWDGNKAGEGFEFFILWLGMSIALIISGGGKFSIDRKFVFQK